MKFNKEKELQRLQSLIDKPKEGESTLHLDDGSRVVVPSLVAFSADVLYGNGTSARLFSRVSAIDESGGSRIGELLSMVVVGS